jgi:hypothetical protein
MIGRSDSLPVNCRDFDDPEIPRRPARSKLKHADPVPATLYYKGSVRNSLDCGEEMFSAVRHSDFRETRTRASDRVALAVELDDPFYELRYVLPRKYFLMSRRGSDRNR